VGYALPETVEFFSRYRCRLYFVDLFENLPFTAGPAAAEPPPAAAPAAGAPLRQTFAELLGIPAGTQLDVCLFWDIFNFLEPDAIAALLAVLRPHLHGDSLGHGFAVHSLKTPQSGTVYGIRDRDRISLRSRPSSLPGYSPCSQGQLDKALDCWRVSRSVLLAHSRLELLLRAKP
jgi:hypothetical protein